MADSVQQSPEDDALLNRFREAFEACEPYHRRWRKRADHFYGLYHNYQQFKSAYQNAQTERDRDATRRDGQQKFGAQLFIPMAFSAVETVVPKVLANRPKMKAKPRDQVAEANVSNVEALVDVQQEQMNYELKLQEIAKDGLMVGLGVQKILWKTDYQRRKQWVPSVAPRSQNPLGAVQATVLQQIYDDPDAQAVDPFDFIWDPYGFDIDSCEWVFHRTWRPDSYVIKKAELEEAQPGSGWRNLDRETIERLSSTEKFDAVWSSRRDANQMNVQAGSGRRIHEVIEAHNGSEVIIILDRLVVVAAGQNPFWHGKKPFQIYRPTHVPHLLHGKGEIEPIEDLQEEMNVMRRQRRDNASFVLQRVIAYADGLVNRDDIQWYPGAAIPIEGGIDPREAMFPIPQADIPYSSYQEEDRLRGDVDRTIGLSDPVMGVGGGGDTATAAQLVFQAASDRIRNKTLRLDLEVVNPGTEMMVELDQQRILRRDVRMPSEPDPTRVAMGEDSPERRWEWVTLTPLELRGSFAWSADGSTTPDNVPQMRADADSLLTGSQNNDVLDKRKVTAKWLELMGIKNPEHYLAPPDPTVPPETLDLLVQKYGVDRGTVASALNEALTGQEPPTPDQAATNGASTPAPEQQAPAPAGGGGQ